jgi:peptide/nickel transport system substrate-binding protein
MPNPDNIAVWSDQISGPPSSFANLTAYGLVGANPQAWYFHD